MLNPTPMDPEERDAQLMAEPYLRCFVMIGDTSLEPARKRFRREQDAAMRILQMKRIDVPVRHSDRGMLTTSYEIQAEAVDKQGEPR